MPKLIIYVTVRCGYCTLAKRLLDKKGVTYETRDVSHDRDRRLWLVEASGQRTVPQIFIDDRSLGGYAELAQLDKAGELDGLLGLSAEG